MKAATKDFIREPGAGALTSNDQTSLERYRAARKARQNLEDRVKSLEERINSLEQIIVTMQPTRMK